MARIALLVTGASGMLLPVRLLGALLGQGSAPGPAPAASPSEAAATAPGATLERVHLVVSEGARRVLAHELGAQQQRSGAEALIAAAGVAGELGRRLVVHDDRELDAAIASGSYRLDATLVVPCSSGTLGALATGGAATLVARAGQVALKERWPLVLGFRETPLSLVHLENLRRLAYAGAVILPPIPAFYVGGESLERFVEAWVLRVLDAARLPREGAGGLRWQGPSGKPVERVSRSRRSGGRR